MFPRHERIHTKKDIEAVFKKSKRYHHLLFTVWVLPRESGTTRALVICSRKVDKRATERNRLKRRVREILRKEIVRRVPHADIIISLKPASAGASAKELKTGLFHVFPLL